MDPFTEKLSKWFNQYKFLLLIAAAGVLLMLIPSGETEDAPSTAVREESAADPGEALENILTQIQGVGKVSVLLTVAEGERTLYEYDEDSSDSSDSISLRRDTVIITDSQRSQTGLVRQVIPPRYLGAVVVCQGGDQAGVRLAVVEAVSAATGLTADKITVLKMK